MSLVYYSEVDPPRPWVEALRAADPALEVRVFPECGPEDAVEAALAWKAPPGFYRRFPNLRLIVNLGAGVDDIVRDPTLPEGIPITRISDPEMARMMAQYVLTAVMRHFRDFGRFERARAERRWAYVLPRETRECTVGVLGLGQLGAAAAAELARQGLRVLGWSRTPKALAGVECHAGIEALPGLLAQCEICVLLLPLTPETENLMSAERFAQLPRGAKFVSCGRGRTVDEAALVEALRSGHIAEATLDVFHAEPLAAEHPLWTFPQVLITPHLASVAIPRTAARQIADNLARVRRGEPALHQIDRRRGY